MLEFTFKLENHKINKENEKKKETKNKNEKNELNVRIRQYDCCSVGNVERLYQTSYGIYDLVFRKKNRLNDVDHIGLK